MVGSTELESVTSCVSRSKFRWDAGWWRATNWDESVGGNPFRAHSAIQFTKLLRRRNGFVGRGSNAGSTAEILSYDWMRTSKAGHQNINSSTRSHTWSMSFDSIAGVTHKVLWIGRGEVDAVLQRLIGKGW